MIKSSLKYILAASVALILTVLVIRPFTGVDEKIMQEVVKHHLEDVSLEVESTDLVSIQNFLNQLDFSLIDSYWARELKLIGARGVRLMELRSAELSYRDFKGRRVSVYQLTLPKQFRGQSGRLLARKMNGVDVVLYSEKGLLIAKAVKK